MSESSYVLITSARDEETYIVNTLKAVVQQTILPVEWVVVSDGSRDRTDEIVLAYASRYSFIRLLRLEHKGGRNFASKAACLNQAYSLLRQNDFQYIGNLDADVSFSPDYFETLVATLEGRRRLGIVGGIITELFKGRWVPQSISLDSVAGATQFFRRECFDALGGYMPLELGGEDALLECTARMKGWEVRTIPHLKVSHHRRVSSHSIGQIRSRFRQGVMFYRLGYTWLFFLVRCLYKVVDRPRVFGSLAQMCGFCFASGLRQMRAVPVDVRAFLRKEQRRKLLSYLSFGWQRS